MSPSQEDPDDLEEDLTDGVRNDLKEKEPSDEKKKELLEEHRHHLVRKTTSQLSMEPDVMQGVEAVATAEVPDMFCFTCNEWVGLSGVDLRGKPRSKADAYYLGGPPQDILEEKNTVREQIGELAERIYTRVDRVDDADEAFEFVADEIEQIRDDLEETGEATST